MEVTDSSVQVLLSYEILLAEAKKVLLNIISVNKRKKRNLFTLSTHH